MNIIELIGYRRIYSIFLTSLIISLLFSSGATSKSSLILEAKAESFGYNAIQKFQEVGGVISDAGTIFGSITSLVIATVPLLIMVSIIGFLSGAFDSILGNIKNKVRF